ncbi:porin family protein [Hymenobacter arizonensis]|uniref:Outer membrane protein beta-barrel domain-containing protein n=1 Tax=Hymenobacter arizonensis TaxID=1227077 RepID=A0A1I6B8P1_HYMAR|nr:porin family protein [Hymenobacter arizonensis]SFQ77157.1 Outer membrane protein beta-barrel domain-containing protein [Hymenobacter arizonensis]
MKKSAFFVASLLATAAISSAQAQDVRLGLRAGANYSNLAGNVKNENTFNNKVGFLGGVMVNIPVLADGFLSVQPEVLYSQKGFENKPTEYTGLLGAKQKREGNVNYNYIDVPLLLKINAGGFIAEAGPQYSYLLGANDETKTTTTPALGGSPTTTESQNKRDVSGLNRNELGYVAGVGYQANSGLSLSLRYTGAFSDFVKSDNNTYFNGDLKNARHSAFQLSLGYLIGSK